MKKYFPVLAGIFVCFHTLAIVSCPAPRSTLVDGIRPLFEPYLKLLHLNNRWAFFAPDPASGILMRYQLQDAQGGKHVFKLTESLQRRDPLFLRYSSFFNKFYLLSDKEITPIGEYLCREHAELNPVQIRFIEGHQVRVSPQSYIQGDRPLDDRHMKLKVRDWIDCDAPPSEG